MFTQSSINHSFGMRGATMLAPKVSSPAFQAPCLHHAHSQHQHPARAPSLRHAHQHPHSTQHQHPALAPCRHSQLTAPSTSTRHRHPVATASSQHPAPAPCTGTQHRVSKARTTLIYIISLGTKLIYIFCILYALGVVNLVQLG